MKTNYTRLIEKRQTKVQLLLYNDNGGLKPDLKDFKSTRIEVERIK